MKNNVMVVCLLLILGFTALKGQQQATLNGWVSDQQCAAKGAKAGHKECAQKCIETGKKLVLVRDADSQVFVIENPQRLVGQEGRHITVVGIVDPQAGTLNATSWSPFGSPSEGVAQARQSETDGGSQAAEHTFRNFVDSEILGDFRPRLGGGNCENTIRITNVSVVDKLVEGSDGLALIEITADWVAANDPIFLTGICSGFSKSRGNPQKARVKAHYTKWEAGWRFDRAARE